MKRPAWCGDCQEFQPVALDSLGFWECQTCGCPTECGECGQTMTDDHECGEDLTCRSCGASPMTSSCHWRTCGCGDA